MPCIPILSSLMQMAASISCVFPIFSTQGATSSVVLISLAKAVAYVSAKVQSLQIIMTASAFPKLKEGPTVPDEVQIPRGAWSARMVNPTFSDRGDVPANTEISMFSCMSA